MIAKRLESLIVDMAGRGPAEMTQRFQKLRDMRLLPTSRGKSADHLSADQIASGLLSIIGNRPGYAGLEALTLKALQPVGGASVAFMGASNLGKAIEHLVTDKEALNSFLELRVSFDEVFTNGHGLAELRYLKNGNEEPTYYVGRLALTLMQSGAEKTFDPRAVNSTVMTQTVFLPRIFKKIMRLIEEEKIYAPLYLE